MSRISPLVVAVAVLAFPLTVVAQSSEVGAFATVPAFEETSFVDPELGFDIELGFEENVGYGVSYNRFWTGQLSTEFAAQRMSADMEVSVTEGPTSIVEHIGEIEVTAFSGVAQWHFAPQSRIAPYVGAGLAHLQGEVKTDAYWSGDPLEEPVPAQSVDLESETTWLINGGVNFSLTPSLALGLDAKYIAYEPKGEGESDEDSIALNPLVVSAGLKFRF